MYTRSDGARHIFAPLQYITALVPAVRGSRVYIVNIRRDLRRINNIRIAARSRASIGPLLVNPFTPVELVIRRACVSKLLHSLLVSLDEISHTEEKASSENYLYAIAIICPKEAK